MQALVEKLIQTLPPDLLAIKTEINTWLQHVFVEHLRAHNFVTREEFDLQVSLLHRTRAQCQALEAQLTQLTQDLNSGSKTAT